MIENYHTHTPRCRHASGTERQYAQAALQAGLTTLGFADHTPQWFPGDYYSTFRMFPEQLPEYVRSVLQLRKDFAGTLRIPLGLEAEYYPALFPEMLQRVRDAGIEYLLLGQHFVGNEMGEHYSGRPTADEDILRRYCRQILDAMDLGVFTYLAHPDLIHFTGDAGAYKTHMAHLCRSAAAAGFPLELNLLGYASGRHYPNPLFWELAAEAGCRVVLGRDAHTPEQLLDESSEAKARSLAESLGIMLQETLDLLRI